MSLLFILLLDTDGQLSQDEDREVTAICDISDSDKDTNNNAQRIKSVVVASTSKGHSKSVDKVRQRITFSDQSEAEEGEISTSDNTENWDSFMEKANDSELVDFLRKHKERINRVTEQQKKKEKDKSGKSGEEDFLAQNIQRMSMLDKSNQLVRNNSEDTIYSRLVKERQDFEQRERTGEVNMVIDGPQRSNNSNDSSLNMSSETSVNKSTDNSTDGTDKNVVFDRFVNSPLEGEAADNSANQSLGIISDHTPSPK